MVWDTIQAWLPFVGRPLPETPSGEDVSGKDGGTEQSRNVTPCGCRFLKMAVEVDSMRQS